MTPIDHIMTVMEAAFDPQWGEAWNREQVDSALAMPHTHVLLVDTDGERMTGLDEVERTGNGQVSPSAAGFVMTRSAPGEEELLLIAVTPDARRRGLGRKLIALMIEDARARGADRIFLEMRSNNPAERLYRAVGFEPIGRRPDYYSMTNGEKLDAITFGLTI